MLCGRLTGGQEYTYIDVYERGKFVSEAELIVNSGSHEMLAATTVIKVRLGNSVRVLDKLCQKPTEYNYNNNYDELQNRYSFHVVVFSIGVCPA